MLSSVDKRKKTYPNSFNSTFQFEKLALPGKLIPRIVVESSLEEGYIYQGTVKIHEFKEEYLERVQVLVFSMCAWILHIGQADCNFVVNL